MIKMLPFFRKWGTFVFSFSPSSSASPKAQSPNPKAAPSWSRLWVWAATETLQRIYGSVELKLQEEEEGGRRESAQSAAARQGLRSAGWAWKHLGMRLRLGHRLGGTLCWRWLGWGYQRDTKTNPRQISDWRGETIATFAVTNPRRRKSWGPPWQQGWCWGWSWSWFSSASQHQSWGNARPRPTRRKCKNQKPKNWQTQFRITLNIRISQDITQICSFYSPSNLWVRLRFVLIPEGCNALDPRHCGVLVLVSIVLLQ